MASIANTVKAVGQASENATLSAARGLKKITRNSKGALGKVINEKASGTTSKIAKTRLANESWLGKAADNIAFADVKVGDLKTYAKDLNLSSNGSKYNIINRINEATKDVVRNEEKVVEEAAENAGKKISSGTSGIGKNALIGTLGGSVVGAGAGGLTAMATGADEDNTKGLIVTGALAGGLAGSMVGAGSKMIRNKSASGSFFMQDAMNAAEQMAKNGGKNKAVLDGAKGVLGKARAKVQSIPDSIDNIGSNISNKFNKDFINENSSIRKEIAHQIKRNQGGTTQEALQKARKITDTMSSGSYKPENVMEQMVSNIYNDNVTKMRWGNALGGAAQGAIMGSAGGALVGGISGGIDEDESFLGGAIKGGFIGGTLGGIGGAASGYFNNSARLLSNTTSNINSLFKK